MTDPAIALDTVADQLLARAADAHSGRATQAFHAAGDGVLTTVALALLTGRQLSEHANPGEAFLHVLSGRLRLSSGDHAWELGPGEIVAVPQRRHSVLALQDSVALLTIAHVSS